jgi:hypothetical protein
MTSHRRGRRARAVLLAMPLVLTVAACSSDDEPSASDQVCDAREDTASGVDDLREAVEARDLEAAAAALGDIQTGLAGMSAAAGDVGAEEREKLQPQVERIQAAVAAITEVETIADLGDQLRTIGAEIDAALDQLRADLRCT